MMERTEANRDLLFVISSGNWQEPSKQSEAIMKKYMILQISIIYAAVARVIRNGSKSMKRRYVVHWGFFIGA
jgi:hypothetical protein